LLIGVNFAVYIKVIHENLNYAHIVYLTLHKRIFHL